MKYLCVIALGLMASGCVVKQNPAKTVVVYPDGQAVTYHCPPGHHKKGHC